MLLLVKYQVCTRTNVHIYVFKDGPTNNTHDNDDNDDDDSNKSYNIIDILFKKAAMHFKCKYLVKDFFFPFQMILHIKVYSQVLETIWTITSSDVTWVEAEDYTSGKIIKQSGGVEFKKSKLTGPLKPTLTPPDLSVHAHAPPPSRMVRHDDITCTHTIQ